jgi:septation ring formation regulator EzrA
MSEDLEKPPEERSPRERLRGDQKAAKRWRQHEVQARVSRLEKRLNGLMPRIESLFDQLEKAMPGQIVDISEAPKELESGDRQK